MIWVAGRVVPDEVLAIPAADRAFEHGLGLFETLRTWDGRTLRLEAHRARMLRSAGELGIPIEPNAFPDPGAVSELMAAEGHEGDRMLRITASGGVPGGPGPVVWMRSAPLPPASPRGGFAVSLASWVVADEDPTARHKMLNYWSRRIAYEKARAAGFDEVLTMTPGGFYWEGSRTSLFAVTDDALIVPSLDGPIVPGVMRQLVLDLARDHAWEIRDVRGIPGNDLRGADEVFLTNAVRGIIPVSRGGSRTWDAPGPRTRAMQLLVSDTISQLSARERSS